MTKLLTSVLEKVSELPEDRQDDAAHVLLKLLQNDAKSYRLTDKQLREVELAKREVRRGKVASKKQISALWRNFGA